MVGKLWILLLALCWKEKLLFPVDWLAGGDLLGLLASYLALWATVHWCYLFWYTNYPRFVYFCQVSSFFRAFPYRWAQQRVSGVFWTFSRQPWFLSVWKWYLESMIWELGVIIAFGVSLRLGRSADRARGERYGVYSSSWQRCLAPSDVTGFLPSSLIPPFFLLSWTPASICLFVCWIL